MYFHLRYFICRLLLFGSITHAMYEGMIHLGQDGMIIAMGLAIASIWVF